MKESVVHLMSHLTKSRRSLGFTLIEILVVVSILSILAAFAVPNYQEYIRRSHRSQARAALLQAAQWMEQGATTTGSYPSIAQFNATSLTTLSSQRYQISLTRTLQGFIITATPLNDQVKDKCQNFTLTHAGTRGVSGSESVANCWNR